MKATVNGMTSYSMGDSDEVSGGVVKKCNSAGGQRIALRSGGTLYWLLTDHLGRTAVTVSGTTEVGEVRYRAFGATRFTSGTTPTNYRFTGQREEASLGLCYYGARWYDPALGHPSVSPFRGQQGPDADHALDYHRYAYGRFNPLKYTDPVGHCLMPQVNLGPTLCVWRSSSGQRSGSLAQPRLNFCSQAVDLPVWTNLRPAVWSQRRYCISIPAGQFPFCTTPLSHHQALVRDRTVLSCLPTPFAPFVDPC